MHTGEHIQQLLQDYKSMDLNDLQQRAENGEALAQFELAVLQSYGRGVPKNEEQSLHWLERAAAQGHIAAITLLGRHALEDEPQKAAEYLLQAAGQGDADAQCTLADAFYAGQISSDDKARDVVHWYEQAARNHQPKAQYMLGKLHAEGSLIKEDPEAAFQWLSLAIMNGSEPAQQELAMLTAGLSSQELERYKNRMMEKMQPSH